MNDKPTLKDYTPTQMLFLNRLEHLVSARGRLAGLEHVPWPRKLVPLAIYSTMLDCRELGIEDEALRIIESDASESRNVDR